MPRELGEPLIPFFQLSAGYQHVDSDVSAANTRLEAGYGPVAFDVNWTRYKEDGVDNDLDLSEWYALYRMSFAQYLEVDLGLGTMVIAGERQRSGLSMTTPVRIQPVRNLGIAIRPAWAWIDENTISDVELTLSASVWFASLDAGYRRVKAGSSTLDGPVVSLVFHL